MEIVKKWKMEFLKERILLWFEQILIFVKFNRRSETNMIHFEWFHIHFKHICSSIVSTLIYELSSKSSTNVKMARPCRYWLGAVVRVKVWQCCWWHNYISDLMLVTILRCLWHINRSPTLYASHQPINAIILLFYVGD